LRRRHAAEEHGHGQGGGLVVGDVPARVALDEEGDLLARELLAAALAQDDVHRPHDGRPYFFLRRSASAQRSRRFLTGTAGGRGGSGGRGRPASTWSMRLLLSSFLRVRRAGTWPWR